MGPEHECSYRSVSGGSALSLRFRSNLGVRNSPQKDSAWSNSRSDKSSSESTPQVNARALADRIGKRHSLHRTDPTNNKLEVTGV
jgi:hypothetical protein